MSANRLAIGRTLAVVFLATGLTMSWSGGCTGASLDAANLLGAPLFPLTNSPTPTPGTPPSTGGTGSLGNDRSSVDPCTESLSRRSITISLRNLAPFDHVHYFLVMVAFVQGDVYPDGGVCPTDVPRYTQFGYTQIPAGSSQILGDYCIVGPALVYFHRQGSFRAAGGGSTGTGLASAIAPARGTNATFDDAFTSAGLQMPIPDLIAFHNPGTGEGARLKVSRSRADPCNPLDVSGSGSCSQDGFYYVDEQDQFAGSSTLGTGSGRRIPSEFQGTGCQCSGFVDPFWSLAPSNTTSSSAFCNEFLRGGRIDFVFIRDDRDPPIPQLVWRVTDSGGSIVHNFDNRVIVP